MNQQCTHVVSLALLQCYVQNYYEPQKWFIDDEAGVTYKIISPQNQPSDDDRAVLVK